jgi:hypothetical protein
MCQAAASPGADLLLIRVQASLSQMHLPAIRGQAGAYALSAQYHHRNCMR